MEANSPKKTIFLTFTPHLCYLYRVVPCHTPLPDEAGDGVELTTRSSLVKLWTVSTQIDPHPTPSGRWPPPTFSAKMGGGAPEVRRGSVEGVHRRSRLLFPGKAEGVHTLPPDIFKLGFEGALNRPGGCIIYKPSHQKAITDHLCRWFSSLFL